MNDSKNVSRETSVEWCNIVDDYIIRDINECIENIIIELRKVCIPPVGE